MGNYLSFRQLENTLAMIKKELKEKGLTTSEIANIPVMLGDDEELNGVHTAFYCEVNNLNEDDYSTYIYFDEKPSGDFILIS